MPSTPAFVETAQRAADLLHGIGGVDDEPRTLRFMDLLPEPAGAIHLDTGRLLYLNEAACYVLGPDGLGVEHMEPEALSAMLHPADLPRLLGIIDLLVRQPEQRGMVVPCRIRTRIGRWRAFQVAFAIPHRTAPPRPRTVVWVAQPEGPTEQPEGPTEEPEVPTAPTERAPSEPPPVPEWEVLARQLLDTGLWTCADGVLDTDERWRSLFWPPDHPPPTALADWASRVHPEDRVNFEAELATLAEGFTDRLELELQMRDRQEKFTRVSLTATAGLETDEVGRPRRVLGTLRSVEAQRTMLDEVAASASWFRTLVEGASDSIAVHHGGRLLYANQRCVELLGLHDLSELIDRPVLAFIHADDREHLTEQLRSLPASEPLAPVELRVRSQDGAVHPVELSSVQLELSEGPAVVSILRDIRPRKELQSRLAQSDRMASLGLLAAGVAHEINNPLAYVSLSLDNLHTELPSLSEDVRTLLDRLRTRLGASEAARLLADLPKLATQSPRSDLMESVQDAMEGTQRVRAIVKDLRMFSHMESDEAPIDINAALTTAINLTRHRVRHQANLTTDLGELPRVMGDEGRLSQVFINLLVNAADAVESAPGPGGSIHVRTELRDGEVVISVQDTGPGVPDEHRDKLFDPFFTTKPAGVGSGLGLAICQHITRSVGGRIELDSAPQGGAIFRVVLPALVQTTAPERASDDPTTTIPPSRAPMLRLLLVDDEEPFRRHLRQHLAKSFEVMTAESGRDALALLERDQGWDIILSDVMMGELSGIEMYHRIEADHPDLADRVVFITGGAVDPAGRRFLEQTRNVVLEKPVDPRNLGRLLRHLARTNQPGSRATPAPRTARAERRAGVRHSARHLQGVLDLGRDRVPFGLIDYSSSGIRATGLQVGVPLKRLHEGTVSLHNAHAQGRVQGRVRFTRHANDGDPCFRFEPADPTSARVYQAWLSLEA